MRHKTKTKPHKAMIHYHTHHDNDVHLGLVGDGPMSHVAYCSQDAALVAAYGCDVADM